MVRVWYRAPDEEVEKDPRQPCVHPELGTLDVDKLFEETAIEYFKIDADNFREDETLNKLHKERHYKYHDHLILDTKKDKDILKKKEQYYREHLHEDEEIRLFLSGSGYFDARDLNERWIRIELEKGDMIVLPAGIFHHFTLDTKEYVTMNRYFTIVPRWTAHYRKEDTSDNHPARKAYLEMMKDKHPKAKS